MMSSASFVLKSRDGNKISKECTLADGNNLSSLSNGLRTLKGLVNDALSEIVEKEKSTTTEGTAKKQESGESELSEGIRWNAHVHFKCFNARLQTKMMTNKSRIQRN